MDTSSNKKWLKQALENHQPLDKAEAEAQRKCLNFLTHTQQNPFSRKNPEGHFTASVLLLSPNLDKILLTHHLSLNTWLQLGGHIEEEDETLPAAALREAQEESGIKALEFLSPTFADIDAHAIPANPKKGEGEHTHFDIRFFLRAKSEDFIVSNESNDLKWCTMQEALQLNNEPSMQRFVAKWQKLCEEK